MGLLLRGGENGEREKGREEQRKGMGGTAP